MKTLKLEHNLAELVRQGSKSSTWRMYDDKNIAVNDEIELIDKVDPNNAQSWISLSTATVDLVVEKRLGDVVEIDMDGHEPFSSRDEMLSTYQKYYGPQVTFETPIKMVHFTLHKKQPHNINNVVSKTSRLVEAKMFADGGSRGNPGPSASGFVIMTPDEEVVVKNGEYIGITTNNQAEYQALKFGLEESLKLGVQELHVYMDSLLVVNQMKGIFKVKNRDLWPIHSSIKELATRFKRITFTHVPRELNKLADREVNEALDANAALQPSSGP